MRVESLEVFPSARACYVRVRAEDGTTGVGESTYFGWPEVVADIANPSAHISLDGTRSTPNSTFSPFTGHSVSGVWPLRERCPLSTRPCGT